MIMQISSGKGPLECEYAAILLFRSLKEEFPDIEFLSGKRGTVIGTYSSILFYTSSDLSSLDGTIQWICQSTIRPHHKRKNWFITISRLKFKEPVIFDEKDLKYDYFRSGGKGGQHVNKTDTGVRLIHMPSGITVKSTAERSQLLNKKDALRKMKTIFDDINSYVAKDQEQEVWKVHNSLVRGNPVRIYQGADFKLKEEKQYAKSCD